MELSLNAEERELLLWILEQRHFEMQKEISHTDHCDLKQALRGNEGPIESMLGRLRTDQVVEAA